MVALLTKSAFLLLVLVAVMGLAEGSHERFLRWASSKMNNNNNNNNRAHYMDNYNRDYDPSRTNSIRQFHPSRMDDDEETKMMEMLMQSMIPKSVSRLLFDGNETVTLMDIIEQMSNNKPRTNGQDEYACINRCMLAVEQAQRGGPKTGNCSQITSFDTCVMRCPKTNGVLINFVHNSLAKMEAVACGRNGRPIGEVMDREMKACAGTLMSDMVKIVKLVHHYLGCYLELVDAKDNKDTCYVIKHCVNEKSRAMLTEFCGERVSIGLSEDMGVMLLTIVSDGRLVNECPALFEH